MIIAVAADHGGFSLKKTVIEALEEAGHKVIDLGTDGTDPVDYPDYAQAASIVVIENKAERAVVICGSGVGACVAANKIPGIRAGACHDSFSAHQGVEDDDMNILCLGARVIGPEMARALVKAFVGARFSGEARHRRRLEKVRKLEKDPLGKL